MAEAEEILIMKLCEPGIVICLVTFLLYEAVLYSDMCLLKLTNETFADGEDGTRIRTCRGGRKKLESV